MIHEYLIRYAFSGTCITSATAIGTATTDNYRISCSDWPRIPSIDEPDPKRRIPFYRALFDQDFPAPTAPKKIIAHVPKWRPNLAQCRIDRTKPQ